MGNMSAVWGPGISSRTRPSLLPADPAVVGQAPAEAQLMKVLQSGRSGGRIREKGARVGAGEERGISYPHLQAHGNQQNKCLGTMKQCLTTSR